MKRTLFMILLLVLLLSLTLISCNDSSNIDTPNTQDNDNVGNEVTNSVVFDITQFANISSQQLIKIMGNPDDITETEYLGFAEFPYTVYDYNNHELGAIQFDLINDKVTAFTIIGELPYNSGNVLETLNVNITNENNISQGELYIKYEIPTENIDLIHATLIDAENDTYKQLSIQYDSRYYTEWNLPIYAGTISPGEYRVMVEDLIKSMCYSPKSADFPTFDWEYARNDYYFCVESYVDAKNAFGTEVRHYFSVVYYNDTSAIVYAILDGEVIADNGYVPTADIIKSLVEGNGNNTEPPINNPDDPNMDCELYTEFDLPITLTNANETITINQITYYCEVNGNTCDLFFTVYSDKTFTNNFYLEYTLYGDNPSNIIEKRDLIDTYGEDDAEGNCIFSIDLPSIPLDNYTISFGDFTLGEDNPVVDECELYTESNLPIKINNPSGTITVQGIDYMFFDIDSSNGTFCISFDLVSDSYVEDFCLNFSLVGEKTGTMRQYSVDEINVYGSDGNYISLDGDFIGELPLDNYTIVFPVDKGCEHNYGEWQQEIPATCTTDGVYGHYQCSKCEKYFDVSYKEISNIAINQGHKYEENICSLCGYVYYSEGLKFEISDTRDYCTVVGIGTCTDKTIYIPPTYKDKPVTRIGDSTFSSANIDSVVIPDSVTRIGFHAFGMSKIKNITIPDSVTYIDNQAFSNCSNLESARIPGSVTTLYGRIFLGCSNLKTVIIDEGVEYICSEMFRSCPKLESISIPSSVTEIGEYAFYDCEKLSRINFDGTKEEWLTIKKYSNWDSYSGEYMIYCTDGVY